ncbi:O-acetyl-ADP-ribose deacetylase MACROD1 [Triplophysa tibetana]|uniref:O-acetyl-ADP-ribose deacetylase MACROD1 n=1 Tax=Triplophysa tibetana TaxID=1572043 RepID=A0A5A9NMY0_9TELE|nr:O-acetyl-ADP-ribose deacetylase MACROD1 [Triplophysa tibetana]
MAFQMSKLASLAKLSKSGGLISNNVKFLSKFAHGLSERTFYTAGKQSANIKVLHPQGVAHKAERWEKVYTTSKSLHTMSGRTVKIALGAVGVTAAVIATLRTSTLHAMNARPDLNLDSDTTDWKEAKSNSSCKPLFKANEKLNMKISLFSGDITKLEIDAIANAAESFIKAPRYVAQKHISTLSQQNSPTHLGEAAVMKNEREA